jgi:c-di-GMP-binding flagellar brake protein YcgR
MATIVSSKRGAFCQLELDSGERIIINMTHTGFEISQPSFFGLVPKPISKWEGQKARYVIGLLAGSDSTKMHPLDVIKNKMLQCRSIGDVKHICQAADLEHALRVITRPSPEEQVRRFINNRYRDVNKMGRDSRKKDRYKISLPLRYVFVNEMNRRRISPVYRADARDISLGGVSIAMSDENQEALHSLSESASKLTNQIMMQITLPQHIVPVVALGQIIHGQVMLNDEQMSLGLGVQFLEFSEIHNEMLKFLLKFFLEIQPD